jgi:hypothetical protein
MINKSKKKNLIYTVYIIELLGTIWWSMWNDWLSLWHMIAIMEY